MRNHDFPSGYSYLAMDMNGDWYYHETRPEPGDTLWTSRGRIRKAEIYNAVVDWTQTLVEREV